MKRKLVYRSAAVGNDIGGDSIDVSDPRTPAAPKKLETRIWSCLVTKLRH